MHKISAKILKNTYIIFNGWHLECKKLIIFDYLSHNSELKKSYLLSTNHICVVLTFCLREETRHLSLFAKDYIISISLTSPISSSCWKTGGSFINNESWFIFSCNLTQIAQEILWDRESSSTLNWLNCDSSNWSLRFSWLSKSSSDFFKSTFFFLLSFWVGDCWPSERWKSALSWKLLNCETLSSPILTLET